MFSTLKVGKHTDGWELRKHTFIIFLLSDLSPETNLYEDHKI